MPLRTIPRKIEKHPMTGKHRKTLEAAEKHQKFHTKHKILSWEYFGIALRYQIHVFGKKFIKLHVYSLKNYFHMPPFIKNCPSVSNKYCRNYHKVPKLQGGKPTSGYILRKVSYSIRCLFHSVLTSYQGQKCLN